MANKQQREPSASSIRLSALTEKHLNAKFIDGLVIGHSVSFKIDSAVEVSVVPVHSPGVPTRLQQPDEQLKGSGNHPICVLCSFSATRSWKARSTKQLLYVLAAKMVPLLGFPASQAQGVCKFLDVLF
ncbi:hypothetical protein MTO96_046964 [Rhipicephalus appendiculatus]